MEVELNINIIIQQCTNSQPQHDKKIQSHIVDEDEITKT